MANSFVRYTGNGTTTTYAIPFSYRDTADLSATVAGVNVTAYTLDAAGTNLTFTTAPANGAAIEIRRTTSQSTKLVDYVSGSVLTENDLDTDSDQAFYMSQEAIDNANDVISLDNADFQWDTQNKRLKNVADPTAAQDAATKNYLENTWLSPANKTALTTVNANIANINAVNSNEANINSVNSNEANINTVATNIGSVNTVATDIAKVITVANDLAEAVSEVETVADDLNEATSEIDTVSNNIANVNTVGTNIANVNTVAGISANVTTVAGNNANVSTVAGISGNVTTVAGISSDVTSVANDATDIGTVATDIANVNTVAGISGNVSTVAGISSNVTSVANNSANINSVAGNATNINTVAGNNSNITTVAGISSNVTTVAGISSDVTAVAGDATDIGTVATDLAGSNNIGTVAGSISNVNAVGGSITNVNTVASNLSGVNSFGERYRVSATAPTTSLDVGDLYYDTGTDTMRVYGSSGWQNAGSSVNGTSQRYNYTATSGQTTFTGADNNGNTLTYDAGFIDVYLNGVKLLNGTDVTVTSGSSVVLASGATTGDVVDIVAYGTFSVASLNADNLDSGTVPSARISGAYTGITQVGTLTGLTTTGNIDFGQNDKARFGTNNDLQIYHDGNHSFIDDTGTGRLYLRGNDGINIQKYTGEEMIKGIADGAVELYHNNSKKFETIATGIYVNGVAELYAFGEPPSTGMLQLQANASDRQLRFSPPSNSSNGYIDYRGGNLLFKDDGTEVARFQGSTGFEVTGTIKVSDGIYLGGTGTANKLDDYEEGSWTVNVSDASGNTVTGVGNGTFTKIGNLCLLQFALNATITSLTSGDVLRITNIPFGGASGLANRHCTSGLRHFDNVSLTSGYTFVNLVQNQNTGYLNFREFGSGVASKDVTVGQFGSSTGTMQGSIIYRTA